MKYSYISIGAQCATATLFKYLNIKKESLPFDWMISTPEFIYTILKLLLVDNISIEEIVDTHFFICNKRAFLDVKEQYRIHDDGNVLVNTKYNVIFPHDSLADREKYIRRITRLKELLLDTDSFLYFTYISTSSPTKGEYRLDDIEPIQDLYPYIFKIDDLLNNYRSNYKLLVFDTHTTTNSGYLNPRILAFPLQKQKEWEFLIPELLNMFSLLFDQQILLKDA